MSPTSDLAGPPPAEPGTRQRVFRDLQAHNRHAHRVAAMLREQREQRIARVILTQRRHRVHQAR